MQVETAQNWSGTKFNVNHHSPVLNNF